MTIVSLPSVFAQDREGCVANRHIEAGSTKAHVSWPLHHVSVCVNANGHSPSPNEA